MTMKELNQIKDEHIQKAFEILHKHFSHPDFTVKKWAKELNITVPYLSKLLRDNTGNAAFWHLCDKRLRHAQKLLAETDRLILDIAMAVGFADNNYFSRIFKKKTHLSPTKWRETYTKKGKSL
jgi:two-component system, response regulator YesN